MRKYPILYDAELMPHLRPIIYGLVDPREPERVRYVGRTTLPATRYLSHVTACKSGVVGKRGKWVRLCRLEGYQVRMVLIEEIGDGDLVAREKYWIRELRAIGQADMNTRLPVPA